MLYNRTQLIYSQRSHRFSVNVIRIHQPFNNIMQHARRQFYIEFNTIYYHDHKLITPRVLSIELVEKLMFRLEYIIIMEYTKSKYKLLNRLTQRILEHDTTDFSLNVLGSERSLSLGNRV